ncbi:DUF4352 domain-containing protein [uncultured Paludibaculum sp.]|uniref:DUF4352 domain-containing protein n=1 Tax=uncultured Paludibaculum sp. TaxID=1765020 RepID=UPI002AAA67A4|nr:DUF4352 domain-containing protein [uncultured Paludibaculum sp.]
MKLPTLCSMLACLGLAIILPGCSGSKSGGDSSKVYQMGAPVKVGALSYTVLDTEWKESLDGSLGARLPENRFLIVNLSITNDGGGDINLPLLSLVDVNGKEYREIDKGEGIPQWLGLLRPISPAQTLSGHIAFDAPLAGYKVRISSGGDADSEVSALVELPLRVEPPPVKGVDSMAAPAVSK